MNTIAFSKFYESLQNIETNFLLEIWDLHTYNWYQKWGQSFRMFVNFTTVYWFAWSLTEISCHSYLSFSVFICLFSFACISVFLSFAVYKQYDGVLFIYVSCALGLTSLICVFIVLINWNYLHEIYFFCSPTSGPPIIYIYI